LPHAAGEYCNAITDNKHYPFYDSSAQTNTILTAECSFKQCLTVTAGQRLITTYKAKRRSDFDLSNESADTDSTLSHAGESVTSSSSKVVAATVDEFVDVNVVDDIIRIVVGRQVG